MILQTFIRQLLILIIVSFVLPVHALSLNLKMPDDTFIKAQVYEANSQELLVWFPSQYGKQLSYLSIASKVRNLGLEVWLVDVFGSRYLEASERNLKAISPWDISTIIDKILTHSPKRVWLFSSEKGAPVILKGMRQWQLNNVDSSLLGGAVLLNPDLTYGIPPVGKSPEYVPIASAVNKPIFILQSRLSEKYFHLDETTKILNTGGAVVKHIVIDKVRELFQFRRLTNEDEDKARESVLPSMIHYGVKQLIPNLNNLAGVENIAPTSALPLVDYAINLNPITRTEKLNAIRLPDLDGKQWDTNTMRDKVLLINFWGEWCSSCRIQLKGQQQLYDSISNPNFEMLSVVFDSTPIEIKKLQKRYGIQFPILPAGSDTLRNQNIRKFPSTLIVDKAGVIRYAFHGAIRDWTFPDMIRILEDLMHEEVE